MVRESIIIASELRNTQGDPYKRDLLLTDRLGLTQDDLSRFRYGRYLDRIKDASRELTERGCQSEIKEDVLAAIVLDEWNNVNSQIFKVSTAISKEYRPKRIGLEQESGLHISNIHLFRDECGAYSGNLLEAKKVWKNFQTSHPDWLRSVTIPLEIDKDVAFLVGIYWANGRLNITRRGIASFTLSGANQDIRFYKRVVASMVERIHHIYDGLEIITTDSLINGKRVYTTYPLLRINSMAIATWIRDDLGFSEPGKNLRMPSIEFDCDSQEAFLSGVIAAKGRLNQNGELYICGKDFHFIDGTYNLLRSLGYRPRLYEKVLEGSASHQITISPIFVRRLGDSNMLVRPEHLSHQPLRYHDRSEHRKAHIKALIHYSQKHMRLGMKASEISEALGLNIRTVFKYLSQMTSRKELYVENHVYSLYS